MTEQEIATYAETYINNVTSSAQSLCWCYFLAGIIFSVCFYELVTFIFDLVKDIIDYREKKQDKKSKKEEVEK